jgi:uncharacterized protein YjbJ (UPF0337 family)
MTVSRTARNQAQTMKGRITEELGRVTHNRRLQRRGRIDRVSGSLKQAAETTKDAFRRNGSDTPMMYDQTRAQQPAGQSRDSAERRRPGPEPLLPQDEQDKIVRRLQHAINTFADTPLKALEEAESAYDEAIAQLVNALAERRSLLRAGWQDQGPEARPTESQSDELRLALRQYREITQRLLRL